MPKRGALALVTTVLAVMLLFNFKTSDTATLAAGIPSNAAVGPPAQTTPGPVALGPDPTATPGGQPTDPPAGQPTDQPGQPRDTATPTPAQPTNPPAGQSGTFTGAAVRTPYGTVQIALVEQNGQIVDVQELQMPFDRRLSAQISQEAGPILRQQVLRAQSANINGVSGASYTSYGYYQSLLSALSQVQ